MNLNQFFILILACFNLALNVSAQTTTRKFGKGTVERIKVHGKGLEGNLEGDSADRYVTIYLPASYKSTPTKRYPVIYFLHGYTDNDARFYGLGNHWMNIVPILDSVYGTGAAKEMIVVTPNAYTRFHGSLYSNSITTGNWEDFIAKELVAYMDKNYRTIAKAASRGIAGHSMGGYGAMRIGQKNPGVFSSIYLLSPCCMMNPSFTTPIPRSYFKADSIKTFEEFEKADFGTKAMIASAAAWSPNPDKPPFYLDRPVENGKLQPEVLTKWAANRPLTTLDQYISNLKELKAIAFDAGNADTDIAASIKVLDTELNRYKIKHFFEIYDGNHINRIAERIEKKMLSFFSENLSFK